MIKYVIKRILQMIPILIGVSLLVFFMLSFSPGDPARLIACSDKARKMLNWQPKYESAEAIIESAWKWQLKFPEGYAE